MITEVVSAHDDEAAFDSLVAAIESQALGRGVDAIVTLAVAGTEDYERWRRNGFTPRKHAFSLQYVPLNDELSDKRDLRDWRFLPGDFDVV